MTEVQDTVAALKGIPTKEELMEMLRESVVEVTFLKLDGFRSFRYDRVTKVEVLLRETISNGTEEGANY